MDVINHCTDLMCFWRAPDFTKEAELLSSGSVCFLELALCPVCPGPRSLLHINTAYSVPVVVTMRAIKCMSSTVVLD